MRRPRTIRDLTMVTALAATWVGLWGSFSAANVLGGLVLAVLVSGLGVGTSGRGGIRPIPLMRLLWRVLLDLVTSTLSVAVEIATPTDRTEEAIVAVPLPVESRQHFLLLIVAITLTPGTAVVDADPDTGTLYLHLLHVDRRMAVETHVHELARLARAALPTDAERSIA